MSFFNQFKEHIHEAKLITAGDHILVAVSGGVDSMVLTHVLAELRSEFELKLSAVHIQHHLRADAEEDARLVKSFCEKAAIGFYRVDLDPETRTKKQSVEAWARAERYAHFNDVLQEINADSILTAHHGNDQVETVLMHIAEGTGIDGLKGIREIKENIVRPLLPFSKAEIEEYAIKYDVPYNNDSTNMDIAHPRNFLRHKVIPNWQRQFPKLNSAVRDLSANIYEVSEIIDFTLESVSKQVVEHAENRNIIIKLNEFSDEPESLKVHLVKYVLKDDGLQWRKHDWENINHLITHGHTGSIVKVGHYEILKNRDTLIIQKRSLSCHTHFDVQEGEKIQTDNFSFKWQATQMYKPNDSQNVETIDAETLSQCIELRPWEEGDYFQPLGMNGHKKVSDYLTDIKMDRFSKQSQFVLADNDEVFWVCGQRISEKVKVTPGTTHFAELSFYQIVG